MSRSLLLSKENYRRQEIDGGGISCFYMSFYVGPFWEGLALSLPGRSSHRRSNYLRRSEGAVAAVLGLAWPDRAEDREAWHRGEASFGCAVTAKWRFG